ncbi:MAG: TetR/AcrR family transcriptional regulator [Clostridia bacterium]|nr:TetR/AcrR family transcriptional regulator [Clostridia bacterium]
MEEDYRADDLRTRLILGGLSELAEHGIRDFSLRRVALSQDVSCAAPYRHFKDKDELILAIIGYVREGWELLSGEVVEVYGEGSAECITELCLLAVRFWLGNGNFRSVLLLLQSDGNMERRREISRFDKPICDNITLFARARGLNDEDLRVLTSTVLTLVYGSLSLASADPEETEFLLSNMKSKVIEAFIPYV